METLSSSDWKVLQDCVSLLEPLFELTEEMSRERFCTSSIVVPLVRGCQRAVRETDPATPTGHKLRSQLMDTLSRRMTPYESKLGVCAKATILDPRFKKYGFGVVENATNTVNALVNELEQATPGPVTSVVIASGVVERDQESEPSKKKKIGTFSKKKKDRSEQVARHSSSSNVKEDVCLYLARPTPSHTGRSMKKSHLLSPMQHTSICVFQPHLYHQNGCSPRQVIF